MNQSETTNLTAAVAPVLASRDVIRTLKDPIEKMASQHIRLDFANVEFISRSAAHELLRLKEWFSAQANHKEIEFVNANKEVSQMLRTVASNRAIPKDQKEATALKTISVNELETPSSPWKLFRRLFAN